MNDEPNDIYSRYKSSTRLTVSDIALLYRGKVPGMKMPTIRWRIYNDVKSNRIHRIGRGIYVIGEQKVFHCRETNRSLDVSKILSDKFPYAEFCVWSISILNDFLQNLMVSDTVIVEVSKDILHSVYNILDDEMDNVYSSTNCSEKVFTAKSAILLKPLITDAPMEKSTHAFRPTIEKLLVDLYADKEFAFLKGIEYKTLFSRAAEHYIINQNKLLRYAGRRNKRNFFQNILYENDRQKMHIF